MATDRVLSGTTRSGSISRRVPSPVQAGQAPWGELNEKLRGSSSSIVKSVVGTRVPLGIASLLEGRRLAVARRRSDDDHALAEPERRLDRIGQPRRVRVGHRLAGLRVDRPAVGVALGALRRLRPANDEAVDDDLDGVALVLVEGRRLGQVVLLAVDPDPHEALLAGRSMTRSPSIVRSLVSGPSTRRGGCLPAGP